MIEGMKWIAVCALALAVAACDFRPTEATGSDSGSDSGSGSGSGSGSDAGGSDASVTSDASPDAPPLTVTCGVVATATPASPGALGSTSGGSSGPDLACPAGELPTGFSFDTTTANPPGGWNEHVVSAVHAHCARLERLSDGTLRVTHDPTAVSVTTGGCGNWPTVTPGSELDCPEGSVVTAMSGNEATMGGTHSLFDHVVMTCAPLDAAGHPTTPTSDVTFTDTGSDTSRPQAATCPGGTAVISFGTRGGCGLDELAPRCAAIACQ